MSDIAAPAPNLWLRLPCIHCGTEIPELIQGTTVKCFQCGTVNTFIECKNLFDESTAEIFGQALSIEFIEDMNVRIQTRMTRENILGTIFSNLESEHIEKLGKYAVIGTPLEQYPIEAEKVLALAKRYNLIAVLLKNYVLPLALTADEVKPGAMMNYFCVCRGLMLVGSYHTIKASKSPNNQVAWDTYSLSSRNFSKMSELAKQAIAEEMEDDRFQTFSTIGEAYSNYSQGLSFISKGNPEWAYRQFSRVRTLLNEIVNSGADPRAKIDHAQVGMIVALQPSIETLFKELREGDYLKDTIKVRSLPVDQADQIIATLSQTRDSLEKSRSRFEGIINFFKKLNFNEELEYVKNYKETFETLITDNHEKYDKVLVSTIQNLINDYKFRTSQVFRRMKIIAQAAKLPGETTRSEIHEQRAELDMLERTLEPTLGKLASLGYKDISAEKYSKEIEPILRTSHDQFDQAVHAAVLELIADYQSSGITISNELNSMLATAKLDSGISQQFTDGRQALDSLSFVIGDIVEESYGLERAAYSGKITLAQSEQHIQFDRMCEMAIHHLVRDYETKNRAIVLGMEPVINSAKLLGIEAVQEIVQAKRDLNALDALFDQVVGTILTASYDVKRGLFATEISKVQALRKRDFTDQVRKATRMLLDFAGRGRRELAEDRNRIVSQAEKFMMQGNYQRAAENFEIAAKISSELGEQEKAKEYSERSKSMERLIF